MKLHRILRFSPLGLALAGAIGVVQLAVGANTDLANEPLTQVASGVRPNIMFILDASGSMAQDYTPDWIDDSQGFGSNPSTTAGCFDSGDDDSGKITGTPDACDVGDPPFSSPDYNTQYYNPDIYYRPGADATGADLQIQNKSNTASWTAVQTDPYGQQQQNQLGSSKSTEDLVNKYPDRVWCTSTSDSPTDTSKCKANSAYTYPNDQYNRTSSSGKYRNGAPYYYRMQSAQWCSTVTLDTCVSGSTANPTLYPYIAAEFCTDSELTNCAAGAAVTTAHTFYGPRWCSDKDTLLNCQRKKIGNFKWPKHLGVTKDITVVIGSPIAATGTLTVTQSASGLRVTSITVDGVPIISGAITATSSSTSALATLINTAIGAYTSSPNYTATSSGSTVTITTSVAGAGENGKNIVVTAQQTGTTSAHATITVNSSGNNNNVYVDGITLVDPTLGAINIMDPSCSKSGDFGNNVDTTSGGTYGNRLLADTGTNSASEQNSLALGIQYCIHSAKGSTGYDATVSGNDVTIIAPSTDGSSMNGRSVNVAKGGGNGSYSTTSFTGGVSTGIIITNSAGLAGGADAATGTVSAHFDVGQFTRVNIVSTNNSYVRGSARNDCAGATCTYAEEMTNFANWYAYYRTRMQMMKSAAGRAFIPIDDTYRVGFITIKPFSNPNNNSGSVDSSRYLRIANFDSSQKTAWYKKFYDQTTGGGTPLREALSRVGRLYAGRFDDIDNGIPSSDDPVEVSCQPNFAILSTDGYWNGNGGKDIGANSMTQQDNKNVVPYSQQKDGVWDGGDDSTVGLADVALYYYQTDLRPSGAKNDAGVDVSADNVPTTQLDFAPHQHMTTFTLGLGLDGTLTYRSDYQTATTGDFYAIKQGTISGSWPNPVNDSPTALDDLWHAAVNARGVFFSASNPQQLANSLTDTLDALKKRVGAGAAAATSNLQPVAGDNFAFTATYQTVDWIGELQAHTIDLTTGSISAIGLWSAQSLLTGRAHTDRRIYTFDASDPYDSTSTGKDGNQMKHFCLSAAPISPWCDDGNGLTGTEQSYFKASQLPQYVSYNTLTQTPNATATNLVNYLRGDVTYEDQGNLAATDLFRRRSGLLGDVIDAQPAYVKASPFGYGDAGYQDFKKCTLGTAAAASVTCPAAQFPDAASLPTRARLPTVYIAANDGMLHAIETDVNFDPYYQTGGIATPSAADDTFSTGNNSGNGVERWAYIPGILLPDLYKLASEPYSHRYFVDGSPTVGDVCLSTPCAGLADWRTMLVGGFDSGGRGFYALDITNPKQPRAMWEFKVRKPSVTACASTTAAAVGATDDCDLGLSYGNPIITKLKATGQWVVIVSSGLNNTGLEPFTSNRQGDGGGYLYILDAATGKILQKIDTGAGSPGTLAASYADAVPSGLAKMNNWVDNSLLDNTTLAVYAGDMMGNLWRFDLDNSSATYLKAVKVAALTDSGGNVQPITTRPELGLISSRRVIFVGTGRFLGNSDKADSSQQSIYAIADDLSGNTTVTNRTGLVEQKLTVVGTTSRTVLTVNAVNWTSAAVRGWFIDLPDSGERVNVDPILQLGTLIVASNVPSTDTCVAGGTAWLNSLDFRTGGYVAGATDNAASQKITGSVVVGIVVFQLPGGKVESGLTKGSGDVVPYETPIAPTSFQGRRVGWRELNADQ
ncbi:MAG: PilC/PilY family type IV pilus protein [Burkholderiales bacterium]